MDQEFEPERFDLWPHPQPHLLPLFFILNRTRTRTRTQPYFLIRTRTRTRT